MGKQTRKSLLQFLVDKGIPIRQAIEMLTEEDKKLTGKAEKEKAIIPPYEKR